MITGYVIFSLSHKEISFNLYEKQENKVPMKSIISRSVDIRLEECLKYVEP